MSAPSSVLTRSVQTSLVEGLARPVGRIPSSVFALPHNADLMAEYAPLYLTGSVLDVTYGRGMWWKRFVPEPFAFHDLAVDGVDFRHLPETAASWDTVVFDPPYIPRAGGLTPGPEYGNFRTRYGLDGGNRTVAQMRTLIAAGLAECARVARRWVLVKCCDYAHQQRFHAEHVFVIGEAERHRLRCHDLIVHLRGPGPGGHQTLEVKRARREHSYLIVFRKLGARR